MGKITGFLQYPRQHEPTQPAPQRRRHWREFVQALDARGIRGSTPVIVVSAAVDVMARARALGALAVVPKPWRRLPYTGGDDGAMPSAGISRAATTLSSPAWT